MGPKQTPVVRLYWDTSVYIALLKGEPAHLDAIKRTLAQARLGSVRLVASTVVLCEVVGKKGAPVLTDSAARAKLIAAFDKPYVEVVALTRRIAERARTIHWEHGLRTHDAIHAATALESGCSVVQSTDRDFKRLAGKFPGVRFEVPLDVVDRELFESDEHADAPALTPARRGRRRAT